MTDDELQQLIQQHGGVLGQEVLDPLVAQVQGGVATGHRVPNPTPTVRLTLQDGKKLTYRAQPPDADGNVDYQVLDLPTSEPPPKTLGGGGPADRYITLVDQQGNVTTRDNPNYQPPKPAPVAPDTTAPFLLAYVPDDNGGYRLQQSPNPNQATVSDAILGLYQSLAPLVQGQQMPLDTARTLISAAHDQLSQAAAYADGVAAKATQMANAANARAISPGSQAWAQQIASGNLTAPPPTLSRLPYDPATFAADQTALALAHISPAAQAHVQAQVASPQSPDASGQSPTFQAPGPPTGVTPTSTLPVSAGTPAGATVVPGDRYSMGMASAAVQQAQAPAQPTFQAPQPEAPAGGGHSIVINIGGSGSAADQRAYSEPRFSAPGGPTAGALAG